MSNKIDFNLKLQPLNAFFMVGKARNILYLVTLLPPPPHHHVFLEL